MDTINFVDEFGLPRTVEVETISKEEYDNFGGTESEVIITHMIEREETKMTNNVDFKMNPGIIYDFDGNAYIYTGVGSVKFIISKETESVLSNMPYNELCKYIQDRFEATLVAVETANTHHSHDHNHTHDCGCDHDHQKSKGGFFSNLVKPTKKPQEVKRKSESGTFGRILDGEVSPFIEEKEPQSLGYCIDQNGYIWVRDNSTGNVSQATQNDITNLYNNSIEFRNEYNMRFGGYGFGGY